MTAQVQPLRAMIPAILGMVSVLARTLGPSVGGWLTDAFGWRSIVYINIVPGIIVTLSGFAMVELHYASGLFNLMRNLGGAVGIAIVNTWRQVNTREQVARIGESLGEAGRHAPNIVTDLAARFSQVTTDTRHALRLAQGELAAHGFTAYAHLVVQRGVSPHGVAVHRGADHGAVLPARIEARHHMKTNLVASLVALAHNVSRSSAAFDPGPPIPRAIPGNNR